MKRKTFLALTLVGVLGMVPEVTTLANNSRTDQWEFKIGAVQKKAYVSEYGRDKTDTSCAYLYCACSGRANSSARGDSFYARVQGSSSANGKFVTSVYNKKSNPEYKITQHTVTYLVNYVKETNKSYANILCNSKNTINMNFIGNWSPDSSVY